MFRRTYSNIYGVLILTGALFACGPNFPNSYLVNDDRPLLSAPILSFEREIRRIDVEIDEVSVVFNPKRSWENRRRSTVEVELDDLQHCLQARGYNSEVIKQTAASYKTLRENIENFVKQQKYGKHISKQAKDESIKSEPNFIDSLDMIFELVPKEFTLYLEGVIYYRVGQKEKAVQAWQKIFDLPADQRHYKSTWAAYMIAKCHWSTDKEKARLMFRQVRQYAREGFADSQDLAATSYGDEAGIYFCENEHEKAVELYLIQTLTKDPTAVPSLKQVCYSIFNKHKDLDMTQLVNNRMVREVLLAYAITQGGEKYNAFVSEDRQKRKYTTSQQILLDAIEQANLEDVKNADRFAAIAYRDGDFERARRWLEIADIDSPMSRRICAKLLLRDGHIREAAEDLAFIARQTHSVGLQFYGRSSRLDSPHKLHSELGTLYVSQKMYIQAVDALMKGGNWIDAAYIAERVLTLEELQNYVDVCWPASMLELISDEDGFGPEGEKAMKIRYLLARRLSRQGQFEQARPYYPITQKEILNNFDPFTNALERANDSSRSQSERADAFWTAAWLMRHKGMEFMGTELSPDWTMFAGNYKLANRFEYRKKYLTTQGNSDVNFENIDTGIFEAASKSNTDNHQLNRPSPDEIERAGREVAIPNKRFHYRYFASDLAWEAAALMENEDPELARRLCLAGTWHRDRDNEHADVFYKSMVLRCGSTPLGQEADRIRWFPKIPDTLKEESPFKIPEITGEGNENTGT